MTGSFPDSASLPTKSSEKKAFIGVLVWKSRQNKDNRTTNGLSVDHEYIVCYGCQDPGRGPATYPATATRMEMIVDPWTSANMVDSRLSGSRRPNLHYDLVDPATQVNYGCPDMGWRYESHHYESSYLRRARSLAKN